MSVRIYENGVSYKGELDKLYSDIMRGNEDRVLISKDDIDRAFKEAYKREDINRMKRKLVGAR